MATSISPTSLKCEDESVAEDSSRPHLNGFGLSHITRYLNEIEGCLESSAPSPALKYEHCYQSDDNKTFFKVVGNVLAKPMLRTLIYGDVRDDDSGSLLRTSSDFERTTKGKKIHFDQRIRESRAAIERERWYLFAFNSLRPAAQALEDAIRHEKAPDLLDRIDLMGAATADERIASAGTKGLISRLASGRRYQGRLQNLISDLFPDLLDEYHEAVREVSDREVFEYIIANDLEATEDELNGDESWHERRVSAAFKCLDRFYPLEAEGALALSGNRSDDGIASGKMSEESCIAFLRNQYATEEHTILENVYINARRDPSKGQKYVPPRKRDSAIIWTACLGNGRHRLSSEFDAVVLSGVGSHTSIESIWEAKKTISPSTLHDILTKKIESVESLMDDEFAELVYKDGDGDTTVTVPFSSRSPDLVFGIYGSEIQSPANAADSIRSIAGAHVVNSNLHEVVQALERDDDVMVEVEVQSTLDIVRNLKSVVESIKDNSRVNITLFIEGRNAF